MPCGEGRDTLTSSDRLATVPLPPVTVTSNRSVAAVAFGDTGNNLLLKRHCRAPPHCISSQSDPGLTWQTLSVVMPCASAVSAETSNATVPPLFTVLGLAVN